MQDGNVDRRRGERKQELPFHHSLAHIRALRHFILPESWMCNIQNPKILVIRNRRHLQRRKNEERQQEEEKRNIWRLFGNGSCKSP